MDEKIEKVLAHEVESEYSDVVEKYQMLTESLCNLVNAISAQAEYYKERCKQLLEERESNKCKVGNDGENC